MSPTMQQAVPPTAQGSTVAEVECTGADADWYLNPGLTREVDVLGLCSISIPDFDRKRCSVAMSPSEHWLAGDGGDDAYHSHLPQLAHLVLLSGR